LGSLTSVGEVEREKAREVREKKKTDEKGGRNFLLPPKTERGNKDEETS